MLNVESIVDWPSNALVDWLNRLSVISVCPLHVMQFSLQLQTRIFLNLVQRYFVGQAIFVLGSLKIIRFKLWLLNSKMADLVLICSKKWLIMMCWTQLFTNHTNQKKIPSHLILWYIVLIQLLPLNSSLPCGQVGLPLKAVVGFFYLVLTQC